MLFCGYQNKEGFAKIMDIITLLTNALSQVREWQEISAGRKELATLSDNELKDIGVSRATAEIQSRRHFWDSKKQLEP